VDFFTSKILGESFGRIATGLESASDQLNAIDAKIGDGDLGVTLTRCGRGVREVIAQFPEDIGMALMMCVQAITKISGASFATLLATALLSVAKVTKGRKEVPWNDIPEKSVGLDDPGMVAFMHMVESLRIEEKPG
jgi:hypothetical protein